MMFTKLLLDKEMKWMILGLVDKNIFKIKTLLNNLALICRFVTLYES